MDKRKLVIMEAPLKGYMEDAYMLSVAITRESSYEWIYSNYIQLAYQNPTKYDNQPVKFFKVSFKNGYIWDAECPLLCCDTITRDMLEVMNIDIIEFISKSICQNKYIKIYLDEFYLPYRIQFKKEHYIHENFFYGFDYEKKELYGLAYTIDKGVYQFEEFMVSMEEVRQAYQAAFMKSVQKERIMMLSCNCEKYYEFDIKIVKNSIWEYINSIQTDLRYREINNPNKDYIFGLNIYDELTNYFKGDVNSTTVIPLHIIYEHKKLMYDRIMYMIENQYIYYEQNIIEDCLKIINQAYICKMLFLKYSYSKTTQNYERLINCINKVKNYDKDFMEKLYSILDKEELLYSNEFKYSRWGLWRDVAYPLGERMNNSFEITFDLHIINDKSKGYVRVTNENCLNNYFAPFILKFDARKEQFFIADSFDEMSVVLEDIECKENNVYSICFTIDLKKSKYRIVISESNRLVKYEGTYSVKVGNQLQFINYIAIIHENAYRFAVSNLKFNNIEYSKNQL